MKKDEIKSKIESGCKIKNKFGVRRNFYYIQNGVESCSYISITATQFEHAKSMCNKFEADYSGLTSHYYWKE